jgi:alpha-methylacyl-CoA racemase
MNAPLTGVRVVEFEGIGPGPLAGQLLAGVGAEATAIARPQKRAVTEQLGGKGASPLRHGKRVVPLDLKQHHAVAQAMALVASADALIEGNRPGVMERLGLGPADCAVHNSKLVCSRMTGWGQSGPLAQVAGHDLNYVALTGLLGAPLRAADRAADGGRRRGRCVGSGLRHGLRAA